MSTRYVWSKNSVSTRIKEGSQSGGIRYGTPDDSFTFYYADSVTVSGSTASLVSPQSIELTANRQRKEIPANKYICTGRWPTVSGSGLSGDFSPLLFFSLESIYAIGVDSGGGYSRYEFSINGDMKNIGWEKSKGSSVGYASSANSGQYPDDALSRNVCLSKRSPSFPFKVHQDQPVQGVFLSITDRERFRHFDKAAA